MVLLGVWGERPLHLRVFLFGLGGAVLVSLALFIVGEVSLRRSGRWPRPRAFPRGRSR